MSVWAPQDPPTPPDSGGAVQTIGVVSWQGSIVGGSGPRTVANFGIDLLNPSIPNDDFFTSDPGGTELVTFVRQGFYRLTTRLQLLTNQDEELQVVINSDLQADKIVYVGQETTTLYGYTQADILVTEFTPTFIPSLEVETISGNDANDANVLAVVYIEWIKDAESE